MRLVADRTEPVTTRIRWIGEPLQVDPVVLGQLRHAGIVPDAVGEFSLHGPGVIAHLTETDDDIELPHQWAAHLFVSQPV